MELPISDLRRAPGAALARAAAGERLDITHKDGSIVAVLMPPCDTRERLDFWLDQCIDWSTLSEMLSRATKQAAQPRTERTS